MTLRELIRAALDVSKDLDRTVVVRVVKRGQFGEIEAVKHVPVDKWSTYSGIPCIVIEAKDLVIAKEERP